MALIAVAAGKGAPGVTTAAVALAGVWPRRALLAECDPAGSELPYWLTGESGQPLALTRGVVSLAAAARAQAEPEVVWEHTQRIDSGVPVLVGPTTPEQATAVGGSWTPIAGMLAALPDTDVVADCGRVLGVAPVAAPVLRRAHLVLIVTGATPQGVAQMRHGIAAVARAMNAGGSADGSALQRIAVVVVGERTSDAVEVGEVLESTAGLGEVEVLGSLALDGCGANGLRGPWGRRLDRSALIRSARTVAAAAFTRAHASTDRGIDLQPAERSWLSTGNGARST